MRRVISKLPIPVSLVLMSMFTAKFVTQFATVGAAAEVPVSRRVERGCIVLYSFSESDGPWIRDVSGEQPTVDLKIHDLSSVQRERGRLRILRRSQIASEGPARKVQRAIRRSGATSIELWIQPDDIDQSGPARVFTMSANGSQRNMTFGQDGDRWDVRFRTSETSDNGIPSTTTKPQLVTDQLTHLVYTRQANGSAVVYANGYVVAKNRVAGNLENWAPYRLAIGDELSGDRVWRGTYYMIAMFDRALSSEEVDANYRAGHQAYADPEYLEQQKEKAKALADARHFETRIAPLLSNHCLECHDSATRQGGLDLSKQQAAFAGGESGPAILADQPGDSSLWTRVEADEMPLDRPPLTANEKNLLKAWLADGAVWSLKEIDPAVYAHGGGASVDYVRRLTRDEYINTVLATVGVDIRSEAESRLPADLRADGFSNTAYNLNVDLRHVEAYSQLAHLIVEKMDVEAFVRRFQKRVKFTDKDMGKLIGNMGHWVLRGPVDDAEVISYRGISTGVAAAGGSWQEAVQLILEAMLQSPRFLYRIEDQRTGGRVTRVSQAELAVRLSYLVWGAPPDRELWDAADEGQLSESDQIVSHVDRMLADPRAVNRSLTFIDEWLNLSRLSNLTPGKKRFPEWNQSLAADMRIETLSLFKDFVWNQERPLSDLLNAEVTFASKQLASHYGFEEAAMQTKQSGNELSDSPRVPLPEGVARYRVTAVPGRGGLLTHGSVLTIGGDEASMVTRGLLVMHELLRGVVKDPPACVDTTPIPTKPGLTQRAIAMQRMANSSCSGCHAKFEPLAFGLEKFDGVGAYHEVDEHGNRLREDGDILFPGASEPVSYQTTSELMTLLAQSERVKRTLTWKLTQFAMGRRLSAADAAEVERIHRTAMKHQGTYQALLRAIAVSELVVSTR